MGLGLPQPVTNSPGMPLRALGGIGTTAPTSTTINDAKREAHGVIGDKGVVSLAVDTAANVTMYAFIPAANAWYLAGASTQENQKAFAEDSMSTMTGAPGALFFLQADTPVNEAFVDAEAPNL